MYVCKSDFKLFLPILNQFREALPSPAEGCWAKGRGLVQEEGAPPSWMLPAPVGRGTLSYLTKQAFFVLDEWLTIFSTLTSHFLCHPMF